MVEGEVDAVACVVELALDLADAGAREVGLAGRGETAAGVEGDGGLLLSRRAQGVFRLDGGPVLVFVVPVVDGRSPGGDGPADLAGVQTLGLEVVALEAGEGDGQQGCDGGEVEKHCEVDLGQWSRGRLTSRGSCSRSER